jgi:anti-sigma regulatory factor (Ser/Thr protein kinase)
MGTWPDSRDDKDLRELAEDAELVTAELVANAVRHGAAPVSLDVEVVIEAGRRVVRIVCNDRGPWDGTPSGPHGGRGFTIVRQLASDVVIDADVAHTTVAALLRRG